LVVYKLDHGEKDIWQGVPWESQPCTIIQQPGLLLQPHLRREFQPQVAQHAPCKQQDAAYRIQNRHPQVLILQKSFDRATHHDPQIRAANPPDGDRVKVAVEIILQFVEHIGAPAGATCAVGQRDIRHGAPTIERA